MLRTLAISVVLTFFSLSSFVAVFLFGQGIFAVIDKYGMVFGAVIVVWSLPAFFGLALLIDKREARSQNL